MLKMIVMDRIHRNWELNPRVKNGVFIDDLSEIIAKDGYDKDKPCTVFEIEGHDLLELACGHHRFEANQKAGNTEIWCEVRQGTLEDLIDTMCEDNQQFDPAGNPKLGQLWTSTEKREAGKLRLLLPKYFAMSDRELAPIFGMDHHATIGRWRRDVVSVAIATSENPYNIEEPRLTELRELVAKREEQNKNRTGPKPKADQPAATQPAATPHANGEHRAIEKANFELDRARENTRASAAELKTVWGNAGFNIKYSEFLEFVSKAYDFELETLRAICFTLSVPGGFSTFNGLSMSELGTWRSRLNSLKGAIERNDAAFSELKDTEADAVSGVDAAKKALATIFKDNLGFGNSDFTDAGFNKIVADYNLDNVEQVKSIITEVEAEAIDDAKEKHRAIVREICGIQHDYFNEVTSGESLPERIFGIEDFKSRLILRHNYRDDIFASAFRGMTYEDIMSEVFSLEQLHKELGEHGGFKRYLADWEQYFGKDPFDCFCDTVAKINQVWEKVNLPISFSDNFLPAAADEVGFLPDAIQKLYEAGNTRQPHPDYKDYIAWDKVFTKILNGLEEQADWVKVLLDATPATEDDTTTLDDVVEQFCEVLSSENSGIEDNDTLMEMLKKASVHYSFDFTRFLYITNMFDIDDAKKAVDYCNGLAPPHIQSWKNTLLSMIRDIENADNWAKGYITNEAETKLVEELSEQVYAEMPNWKKRHSEQGVDYASKKVLIFSVDKVGYDGAGDVAKFKALLEYLKTDNIDLVSEVRTYQNNVGLLQDRWHEVRNAMFDAFTASPLSNIEGTQDYQNAKDAFVSKIESRNPGMDVFSHPRFKGFRGDPAQVKAIKREIEIYERITADIESETDWVVNVLSPFSGEPQRDIVLKADDPKDVKVKFCISIPKAGGFSHEVLWETYFEMPRDYDIERRDKACRRGFELMKELLGVK